MEPSFPTTPLALTLPESTPFQRRTMFVHWLTAISSVTVSAVVQLAMSTTLEEKSRFTLYLPAVMLSVWVGGFNTGVLAFLFGLVVSILFLVAPQPNVIQIDERDVLGLAMYVGISAFTLLFTHTQRRLTYEAALKQHRLTQALVEQKRLETQHLQMLAYEQSVRLDAERSGAMKTQFIAMVAHELRTPLTSIKGFSSSLMAEDVTWPAEDQQKFLRIIDEEADKMTELVDQLMDAAQMQSGQMRIRRQTLSLPEILAQIQAELNILAANHQLVIHIPEELPMILADPKRLGQVLLNLVGNAAKFSPPQSLIKVEAKAKSDRIEVGIQIDVSDEGPGIPSSLHDVVFELFRRLDDGKWQTTKGSGLGLAICKGLVEAHGGTIWVSDQPRVGTTVSLTLPSANAGVFQSTAKEEAAL